MPVLPGDALPAWTLLSPRRHIQDPASQRLTWNKSPKSVLVVKKIRDASLLQPFKELCVYLMEASEPAWGGGDPEPPWRPYCVCASQTLLWRSVGSVLFWARGWGWHGAGRLARFWLCDPRADQVRKPISGAPGTMIP